MSSQKPILIVGSGISGLLLAQHLRKLSDRPFRIFERDTDLATRGLGWGLTLHWSLPALRALLPKDLVSRLPEAYVDRVAAVEEQRASTFPFFDLSTGELKASTPNSSESTRIRVTREKFRRLLSTDLDIEWGKAASTFESHEDGSVTVHFDDGTLAEGSIVVACDGGSSRIRSSLFPDLPKFHIPVKLMGVKLECTPEEIEPIRKLDPYFLQGAASANDTFFYFSTLDAPGNNTPGGTTYTCQIVVSWPIRKGFFGSAEPIDFPEGGDEAGVVLFKKFSATWAEPFRSLALSIPETTTEVKCLDLYDWPPPKDLRTRGSLALLGDALHPMAMYRGEGANHAIEDVQDFVELVLPHLTYSTTTKEALREGINAYEDKVVARARPAVLASRQACIDAHQWERITPQSPLLSKRLMNLSFDESNMSQ
ncbi:hypothetical protein QBC35DRAFT_77046 [Podospora australis]|uniref:FAD-binding domain-containing protein n=1 Tax=Podospora australis TaxID=1536484 RepID=A0AAN7AFI5_9PEZI|nr:hypothetical protein QBC35DRAFT_77046 [Podospora australis]